MALKLRVEITRQRLEFYYSIFLILLIPAIIVFNTYWLIRQIKTDWDVELQRKANLANELLASAITGRVDEASYLQDVINKIVNTSAEVRELSILLPVDEGAFRVAASSSKGLTNTTISGVQESIVWLQGESVAALVPTGFVGDVNERIWKVITPVTDAAGKKSALAVMSVSSIVVDRLIDSSLRQSLIILLASIAAIVLLMANHFRFVGYAVLLKKLKEVDRLKNDFLSVATHELKTPMAVIKGYVSMVQEGVSGKVDTKAKKTLGLVFDQTERLNKLVTDLLDISRIEQGRTSFQPKSLVLSEIIQAVINDATKLAEDKGLKINYQPPTDLPAVFVDADRAQEIFTNLLSNAVKYTEKGAVTVLHEVGRNQLKTIIKDTGIGMSAKDRQQLFSRFYRIRNAQTEHISGTGLGLWIVKQYVEKMGGTISVDSMENVGSQFAVTFPIVKQP